MRNLKNKTPNKNIKFNTNRRPDVRDDLDGRHGEEQLFKGGDVTHNAKERHNKPNRKKR
jgi:hypothetical protein